MSTAWLAKLVMSPVMQNYGGYVYNDVLTFYAGSFSNRKRFSIDHHKLSIESPIFLTSTGFPVEIHRPIILETTDPYIFKLIADWISWNIVPMPVSTNDLFGLMRIWITLDKLGLWQKQNFIMCMGNDLMRSKDSVCDINVVKYVYLNTPPGSKLRSYIINIFCQRKKLTKEFFSRQYQGLGIVEDAIGVQRMLAKVTRANPIGLNGYNLDEEFDKIVTQYDSGEVFVTYLTGNRQVDHSRLRYGLPEYLVWDEYLNKEPIAWFVGPQEALLSARELAAQFPYRPY